MEDTIKIELLTPLTGTFLPNEMEQDWEGEEYHELEEEQVLFDGADLIPYVSEIQEKIAEYSRVGHEDDKTDVIRQIKRCRFHQIKTGLSEHLTMG